MHDHVNGAVSLGGKRKAYNGYYYSLVTLTVTVRLYAPIL